MSNAPSMTEVIEAFEHRGFRFVGQDDEGWFGLRGQMHLPRAKRSYPCEIYLDPRFSELPRVRILERPQGLPSVVPHLTTRGSLCYIAKGTAVLDIFDPVGQSLACLARAELVLDKILCGEMTEDLEEEFYAYWPGFICLDDTQGNGLGWQQCLVADGSDTPAWFITDNEERTKKKIQALGLKDSGRSVVACSVRTNIPPSPSNVDWPPKTLAQMLRWQGSMDLNCRRKILQRVTEGAGKHNGILVLIRSPRLTYGFGLLYDKTSKRKSSRASLYGLEVLPMSVFRIDDRYMAERNIPGQATLAGKQIAIVGCGTIGGYLADMLVKAGAGTSGGRLTLVDPDTLGPQNIGRHRLGFHALLRNKAYGMKDELDRSTPGVQVRALPVDVRDAELGSVDLLIDATGEEALGHWLCKKYLSRVPMLSVWIEGPGTAVRGLLKSRHDGACYRCLWHSARKGKLRPTVDAITPIFAGHGCEGIYVPFPASVSVHAASLAAEMALHWANGIDSPALRTRVLDSEHQLATADCSPGKDEDCAICNS